MPHTSSYQQRALQQEGSEGLGILPTMDSSTVPGWNEYLNWEVCSTGTSAPDPTWDTSDGLTPARPTLYADGSVPTTDAVKDISDSSVCGLQPWYLPATQDLSSTSSEASTRSQLADSAYSSHKSISLGEAEEIPYQLTTTLPWSPKQSRQVTSFDESRPYQKSPRTRKADVIEELEKSFSYSLAEESDRAGTAAKMDAKKKRKIAHTVIEKNYRSRIKDGMAELRQCVPSTLKGRTSSLDSSRMESEHADNAQQSNSSGIVTTLSDAVQYVRSLKHRNEALHRRLDVMQQRNDTLQRIALSKIDTCRPPKDEAMEELDQEEPLPLAERSAVPNTRKRTKTST
jgi:hypothetical protein